MEGKLRNSGLNFDCEGERRLHKRYGATGNTESDPKSNFENVATYLHKRYLCFREFLKSRFCLNLFDFRLK